MVGHPASEQSAGGVFALEDMGGSDSRHCFWFFCGTACGQLSVARLSTVADFRAVDIRSIFGRNVRRLRLERGYSQERLAHLAEIDRTYMPDIEAGRRNVSITIVSKLAKALEVNAGALLEEQRDS
jgi:DNA-binding XRE family transcriptional regulator